MSDIGHWMPRAAGLIPAGDYSLQGIPHRAYSIMKGGKVVGTMRCVRPHGWIVTIEGYRFYTTKKVGAGRFGLTETGPKLFPDADSARAAIKHAFSTLGA